MMAKRVKKRESKQLTRKQRSRVEWERRMERLLLIGVAIVGVTVVGLLVYALAIYPAVLSRKPVVTVDGTPISVEEFQSYVRYGRYNLLMAQRYWEEQKLALSATADDETLRSYDAIIDQYRAELEEDNAPNLASQALDELIEFQLARQEAERRGITVTEEELQRQIEVAFQYDRDAETAGPEETVEPTPTVEITSTPVLTPSEEITATPTITPTPTSVPVPTPTPKSEAAFLEEYEAFLGSQLEPLGISEEMYRSWVESDLILQKLQDAMSSEYPTAWEQIELRYIATTDEQQAEDFSARLQAGEDYLELADEIDAITDTVESPPIHAELPWYPRPVMEEVLDYYAESLVDLAFDLEVGTYTEPLASDDGSTYLILNVTGHEEERELESYVLDELAGRAYDEWLQSRIEEAVEYAP
jgi:parvulin-like peptidyl-prolyl isomerase